MFLKYLCKEFITPVNYVAAFLVGAGINIFQGKGIFASAVPYFIPLVVQSLAKSSVKYKSRHTHTLLQLPGERKDPAFVMDNAGGIISSTGNTERYFQKHKIRAVSDLFDRKDVKEILEALIVSLADKYDALRSARSYKPAMSHEKSCELLMNDDRTKSTGEEVFSSELIRLFYGNQQRV